MFGDAAREMPRGYYSGDKPNPTLKPFAESHARQKPYDPSTDQYEASAFDRPIETTKTSAVFALHAYHLGKKPHDAIGAYIRHYTVEGDLVLDPFCGSGSTALASLIHNRKAIAIDASPAATFVTRFYVTAPNPGSLSDRFQRMCRDVQPDMEFLYQTICHRCGGPASTHYIIYSNEYECPRCLKRVTLFEATQHEPACCPHCAADRHIDEPINSSLTVQGIRPVAVNFSCAGGCHPRRMTRSICGDAKERGAFERIDLKKIKEIEARPIPYPYPKHYMMNVEDASLPWGDEWRPSRNFRRVADLFTYRNLWAIASCMAAAGQDDDLRAVITSGMLAVSRKAQHLDGGGGYIPGNWALPPMSKQRHVLDSLAKVFHKALEAKETLNELIKGRDVCISTQSCTDITAIPSNSVDYIFTDPPYGGTVQYAELNFIWEAWLGLDTSWHESEITVNETRGKSVADWAQMMKRAMEECYRVLKPGRWLSLCYHDTSEGTWALVQDIMGGVRLRCWCDRPGAVH